MLICPQCKFENPNTNKFCQSCGASLTQKVCPECGTYVALNAQQCDNCGAECGTVLWAIMTKEGIFQAGEVGEIGEVGDEVSLSTPSVSPTSLTVGSFLDSQERYQLLESLPALEEIATNTEVCVRVLDCQPYQVSPLEVMLANEQKGLTPSVGSNKIPSVAKPYIALQSWRHLGIPLIYDTWQQEDIQVVLIEDRSNWQKLIDLWKEDTTSSLQIVHFFYQMTQLWAVLETVNCRQSLLELSNLRLDEDQSLALQRLYVELLDNTSTAQVSEDAQAMTSDPKAQPLTVQALGRVWQALFRQSQRTQFGSILHLLGELELGKIQTLVQLQSSLEAIASELEGNDTTSIPLSPEMPKTTTAPTMLQFNQDEDDIELKSDDMPTVVLPMQLVSLENAGLTDVGRQRDHNEDYFGIETKIYKLELPNNRALQARGLYILCDGMGGHAGGEVASALAVNSLRHYFQTHWASHQLPTEDVIRAAVRQANQAIFDLNQQDARSGVGRMGTTLVMVLIQDTQVAVAHVGDSRLYRWTRKKGLEQVTVDHEVGQREISRGVEASVAYSRPDAYQLTQALGPRDEHLIIPDVQFFEINEDTLFVLASDGLSDNDLLTIHGQNYLAPLLSSSANLESGVQALIDLANHYNGHDNITAVVIRAKVRPNLELQQ
jgi:protein phosphatase